MENAYEPSKNMDQCDSMNWSSYYEYMQVHELIGDRKTALVIEKQPRSENCRPAFGLLINKLKKNEADKSGIEAAAPSVSLPSDEFLLGPRSSATRTHSSNDNTK